MTEFLRYLLANHCPFLFRLGLNNDRGSPETVIVNGSSSFGPTTPDAFSVPVIPIFPHASDEPHLSATTADGFAAGVVVQLAFLSLLPAEAARLRELGIREGCPFISCVITIHWSAEWNPAGSCSDGKSHRTCSASCSLHDNS